MIILVARGRGKGTKGAGSSSTNSVGSSSTKGAGSLSDLRRSNRVKEKGSFEEEIEEEVEEVLASSQQITFQPSSAKQSLSQQIASQPSSAKQSLSQQSLS